MRIDTGVPRCPRALAALVLVLFVASPASATPDTLRRSMGNILFAPLDLALTPIVAVRSAYNNVQDVDDTPAVRVVWFIPGVIWNTGVNGGASLMREFIGLVELLPGLGLFFLEADLDPLYDPPEKSDALVDIDTDPLWIKFGVDYLD